MSLYYTPSQAGSYEMSCGNVVLQFNEMQPLVECKLENSLYFTPSQAGSYKMWKCSFTVYFALDGLVLGAFTQNYLTLNVILGSALEISERELRRRTHIKLQLNIGH